MNEVLNKKNGDCSCHESTQSSTMWTNYLWPFISTVGRKRAIVQNSKMDPDERMAFYKKHPFSFLAWRPREWWWQDWDKNQACLKDVNCDLHLPKCLNASSFQFQAKLYREKHSCATALEQHIDSNMCMTQKSDRKSHTPHHCNGQSTSKMAQFCAGSQGYWTRHTLRRRPSPPEQCVVDRCIKLSQVDTKHTCLPFLDLSVQRQSSWYWGV